jgi:hypothetical protein
MPPHSEYFLRSPESPDPGDYSSDVFTEDVLMDSSSDSGHSQSWNTATWNGGLDDAEVYRKDKAVLSAVGLEGLNLGVFIHAVILGESTLCLGQGDSSSLC